MVDPEGMFQSVPTVHPLHYSSLFQEVRFSVGSYHLQVRDLLLIIQLRTGTFYIRRECQDGRTRTTSIRIRLVTFFSQTPSLGLAVFSPPAVQIIARKQRLAIFSQAHPQPGCNRRSSPRARRPITTPTTGGASLGSPGTNCPYFISEGSLQTQYPSKSCPFCCRPST